MSGGVLRIAHRGASGHAPENTLAAFKAALQAGSEAIELDLRQTLDGHLVVLHDETLRRTTGDPRSIGHVRLRDLNRLDAGVWWSPSFKGERVPTLNQVLDLVRDRACLFIDLKRGSSLYPSIESRLLKIIRDRKVRSRVVIGSRDMSALKILRKRDPRLRLGVQPALSQAKRLIDLAEAVEAESVHLSTHRFRPGIPPRLHRRHLKLYLYTVNRPGPMRAFARMGVDGFFTDFPDRDGASPKSTS